MNKDEKDSSWSRRSVLALYGLAGSGLAMSPVMAQALSSGPKPEPQRVAYDLKNPEENLAVYVKLRGSLDGIETFSWTCGQAYGSRPGKIAEPFFDIQTCLRSKWVSDGNGGFDFYYRGMIVYFEQGTMRRIDDWVNPLSGETQKPVHYHTSLGHLLYTPRDGIQGGVTKLAESDSPVEGKVFLKPATIVGDDLWMLSDERLLYKRPSDGDLRVDNLINRYHGQLSEIEDRSRPSANCNNDWMAEVNWSPWMNLGDMPGQVFWGGMGKKFYSSNDLSPEFRAAAEDLWPGAFSEPLGA